MSNLQLYQNSFTGTPDLNSLPEGLEVLKLHVNQFTGTPDLIRLPRKMTLLDLLVTISFAERRP